MFSRNNLVAAMLSGAIAATAIVPAASAAPLAPRASVIEAEGVTIEKAQYRDRRYVRPGRRYMRPDRFVYYRDRHGPRYRYSRRGYHRYNDGYWYREPFWAGAAAVGIIGGVVAGAIARDQYRDYDAHVAWCDDQYRTYDDRTDTYIARAGYPPVRCRSPYM